MDASSASGDSAAGAVRVRFLPRIASAHHQREGQTRQHAAPDGLVPGAPPRQFPRDPRAVIASAGLEATLDPEYQERIVLAFQRMSQSMAQYYVDQTNRVDEYRVQSLAGESLTLQTLTPDYECDEIIESVLVTGPTGPSGEQGSLSNTGTVATPAASALIASVTPGVIGLYTVEWTIEVETAAATVLNNYKLVSPLATTIEQADQPLAIGTYPQQNALVYIASASQAVSITAVASETTATITGSLTVTPYSGNVPFTAKLGKRSWNLQLPPTGILVIGPVSFKLGRSDDRFLTSAISGDWSMELMGHAETGRRGIV